MLISFCMPCFKKEEYLRDAIDSVLMQTHKNIELIVVDDATPKCHGIKEIVKYFTDIDKRVKYYRNDKNLGVANTRNIANKLAKGEIICVQDADDLSYPTRADVVSKYFKSHKEVDVMYGSCELVSDMGKPIARRPAEEFVISRMKEANYINHLTVAYRKNIGVKYRKDCRYIDDWYFYMDCFMAGKRFGWVDNYLAIYRLVGDGLTYGIKDKSKQIARDELAHEFRNLEADIAKKIKSSTAQDLRIKRIIELIPKRSKVIELGCNTGAIIERVKKAKKCKVKGVEVARNLVKKGRAKGLDIVEGDIETYSNGSCYDRVILGDVLEHYTADKVRIILNNSVKLLKQGGKLIITVPYEHGIYSKQYLREHVADYSAEDIQVLIPTMKVDCQPIVCGDIAIPTWLIMTVQ